MAISTSAIAQTTYHVVDLGMLPSTSHCEGCAINDAGIVAGYCAPDNTFATTLAFSWQNGMLRALGKLPQGHYSLARAVNSEGVIGGEGDTGDWLPKVWIIRKGSLLNLDPTGGANIRMIAVTDIGPVIADYAEGLSGNAGAWRPVIYSEDPTHRGRFDRVFLPVVPGGDSRSQMGYATAGNNLLQAAGYVQNSMIGQQAAFWNNDPAHSVRILPPLAGDRNAIAWGINDFGEVVGESYQPSATTAVFWQADAAHTPVSLGMLPGDVQSTATAVNLSGQVVGISIASDRSRRAFMWENGVIMDLTAALDTSGAGWAIDSPNGINSLGQIAGSGLFNGVRHAFVMMPN